MMGDYEREQQRLQKLLEEVLTDEELPDDAESDQESNREEQQDTDSGSEQDITDTDENVLYTGNSTYIGKDKVTRWKKHPLQRRTMKTRKENIVKRFPGPSKETKSLKDPAQIWGYFFDDKMIDIIVTNTNKYIETLKMNYSRNQDANSTTATEIRALIGLIYLSGVYHASRLNTEDLWSTDGSGVEMFRLTMSLQRFRFLLRVIRFDDKQTRDERRATDKLAPIRDLFDHFVSNCEKGFHHSEFVTIDEMLPAFRGKCGFRQYIPSKPNKYGIKVFAVCDSKRFYTSKLEVYIGQNPEGPYKLSNRSEDIVLRMSNHISGTGRNITMDNWFTSLPLVEKLITEHKLTSIGTIRKNKTQLPVEFTKPAARPVCTSMFGFRNNCTLVSYKPSKNKNVLVVSSMHHHDDIDQETGVQQKPIIITDYNRTKGGVDTVDKLCASYSCARNTRRWPMVLFYLVLNVGGINSKIVYDDNNAPCNLLRRNFLKKLAYDLVLPLMKQRAIMTNLPRMLTLRLRELCQIQNDEAPAVEVNKNGRCEYCGWRKNRKTRYYCFRCGKFMCLEHLTGICRDCSEKFAQTD